MEFDEIARLTDPTPLPLEMGYERLPSGVLHLAVRTDMYRCTGEMFEWWFRWRCDTQKYIWWHPVDHIFSDWAGTLSPDTHIGSEHIVTELFTNSTPVDLVIQFQDVNELVPSPLWAAARESGHLTCAVVGRVGNEHQPPRAPDGAVLGGRLAHIGRDTDWGLVLRSHFYLGQDLPNLGVAPEQIEKMVPDEAAIGLLQHCYNEFTFLSRFLPSLYIAEHRDQVTPPVPW